MTPPADLAAPPSAAPALAAGPSPTPRTGVGLVVRKRSGQPVAFDPDRIASALAKAFRAELAVETPTPLPPEAAARVAEVATTVALACRARAAGGAQLTVEAIQDEVERQLMLAGEHKVARRYVLYRERRAQRRRDRTLHMVRTADQAEVPIDAHALADRIAEACAGINEGTRPDPVVEQTLSSLFNRMPEAEVTQAAILAARTRVEHEPGYSYAAARLLLGVLYQEAAGYPVALASAGELYRDYLPRYLKLAVEEELLDPRMDDGRFDVARLAAALRPERDLAFQYLGLQTLYDRYLITRQDRQAPAAAWNLPQFFWMRVAMGLFLERARPDREAGRSQPLPTCIKERAVLLLHPDSVQLRHAALAAQRPATSTKVDDDHRVRSCIAAYRRERASSPSGPAASAATWTGGSRNW